VSLLGHKSSELLLWYVCRGPGAGTLTAWWGKATPFFQELGPGGSPANSVPCQPTRVVARLSSRAAAWDKVSITCLAELGFHSHAPGQ